MNKRITIKVLITTSAVVILGLIMSIVLTSCRPCPDNSEDTGVGRCIPEESK